MTQNVTAKPVYDELKALIKGKWWTRAEATVKFDGKTCFRGFFGQYRVTANVGNGQLAGIFSLNKNGPATAVVRLN